MNSASGEAKVVANSTTSVRKNRTSSILRSKELILTQCPCNSTNDIEDVKCSKVSLCTCQQSKMYPLCDKTHEIFNKETNSNIQPIVVEFSDLSTRKKKRDLLMDAENKVESTVQQQQETKEAVSPSGKKKETTEIVGEKLLPVSPRKEIVFKKIEKKKITAVFTEEEIAKHCTKDDCWMIIKGGVYDITPYFSVHPGGQRALLKFAGKDGTENVQYHSSQMMYLLDNHFYVGKLAGYHESSSCTIS